MNAGRAGMGEGTQGSGARFGDLRLRVITGLAAAVLGLAALWLGGVWTMVLTALVTGAAILEYRAITLRADGDADRTDVPILAGAVVGGVIVSHFYGIAFGLRWLLWSLILAAAADMVVRRRRAMAWAVVGGAYVGLAGIAILYLRDLEQGFATVLWLVLVVIAVDVGGYFAGRLIGGPRLWPRVSPKKTWAGTIGGVALATAVGAAVALALPGSSLLTLCLVSALAGVIAQVGDLAESAVKRHFGVKDSGRLLPGHGGAFDRFDGLIAAALAVGLAVWLHGRTVLTW